MFFATAVRRFVKLYIFFKILHISDGLLMTIQLFSFLVFLVSLCDYK